jgi:hypothetical protein
MNQCPWMQEIITRSWMYDITRRLANTSFMASFQARTEPLSGLSLWACFLLPRPARYLAVYCNGSSFTPSAFCYLTNVQVNITTTLHDTWLTCIYITSALLLISFSTHLPFFLAGWLYPIHGVSYMYHWLWQYINYNLLLESYRWKVLFFSKPFFLR